MSRACLVFCMISVICIVIGYNNIAEAQQSETKNVSKNNLNRQSPGKQRPKPCNGGTKRPGQKNRRQQIPKPERNRIGEGGSRSCRKRKNAPKKKAKKVSGQKRKVSAANSEPAVKTAKKKRLKKKIRVGKTERVDDIPILINVILKAGIREAVDKYVPVQKNQRDLSWGRTAVIWLAYILTTGDHRKVAVQEYVKRMQVTLTELTGMLISDRDFSDDRLSVLANYLSREEYRTGIEQTVSENSIEVYELLPEVVRVDATTVSGFRETAEGELFQFGHSKDDANRPQIKIMTGSLDPLGMPLASDVVSGERADDGLYSPIISRISSMLCRKGLLYVGDCKLSSAENRLHIKAKADGHYLCPLPNTGSTPENMVIWTDEGNRRDEQEELIKYTVINNKGEEVLKAKGYETEREQSGVTDGREIKWTERVLIVKSPAHEQQQKKGLERRLKKAEEKLHALTPPRGRGKRQITEETVLTESAESVLKKHKVQGLVDYEYVKEVEKETKYVGRGRGSAGREKTVVEKVRYQITKVSRDNEKIAETVKNYGWKAYVTDAAKNRLGFIDIVRTYRKQYRIENIFNHLKSRLNIAPLYVKRKDQIKGMTHLLMLGVRIYTLIEFAVRRSLSDSRQKITGLHPENPGKATDSPTCERILKAFSNITLTIFETGDGVEGHLTPMSQIQTDILKHLGLKPTIYSDLEIINEYGKLKLE
ncbi:MAG: IS1634 family transposase [Desulfobacterales bacterium]|nr:IS1634 family transposase [Desulfobacterales bacterium]